MSVQDLGISVDTVWMLLAAMLVFFMQPVPFSSGS